MKLRTATARTNGTGLWSRTAKTIRLTRVTLEEVNDDCTYGEIRVYFNRNDWNVDRYGLIYTDPMFLADLKEVFRARSIESSSLDYTEQGMQGPDYVSLQGSQKMLKTLMKKIGDK